MDKKTGRPNSFRMNSMNISGAASNRNFRNSHGILRSNNGGEGHDGQKLMRESWIKQPTGC